MLSKPSCYEEAASKLNQSMVITISLLLTREAGERTPGSYPSR